MKNITAAILALFISYYSFSQKINKPYASLAGAITFSENENNFDYGLSGGYQFNKTKIGAGFAIDHHTQKTIPVFIEAQRYLFKPNKGVMLIANAGVNLVTKKEGEENFNWWWRNQQNFRYKSGYIMEGGIGYSFLNKKSTTATVSVLASKKTFTEKYDDWVFDGNESKMQPHSFKYILNKISLRMQITF